jgi:signal transduction histidine kinase
VVDLNGRIVLHSNPAAVGKEIGAAWYQHAVPDAGLDVVQTAQNSLSGQSSAYDVRVPLSVGDKRIGEYHRGLDAGWFDQDVAAQQRDVFQKWIYLLGLVVVLDAAAAAALYGLAQRERRLQDLLQDAYRDWASRLGQIASGLAHEIRNPLHALRINLHTILRSFSGKTPLDPDELVTTIAQSNRAIDTLDSLMRDLLALTAVGGAKKAEEVNLAYEIRATLNLMNEGMRRKQVEVRTQIPETAVCVTMDAARVRQILVDLLTFAENNAGTGGSIDLSLASNGASAVLDVVDSGPSLTANQRTIVFEPFQAPRETGSGLGLALVKHFSEEAGGTADCIPGPGGCRFKVRLPLSSKVSIG